jgi:hypothetical protein
MIAAAAAPLTTAATRTLVGVTVASTVSGTATTVAGTATQINNDIKTTEAKDADGKAQLPGLVTIPPVTN